MADKATVRDTGGITAWVLGDQLSLQNPVLDGADRILIVQSLGALGAKRFHRQKLHLILVAMRRYARDLEDRGIFVDYVRADSLTAGLAQHRERHRPERIRLLAPKAAAGRKRLARLDGVELVEETLFLTRIEDFEAWAEGRRRLVMEDFYRWQRKRFNVLMDGERPVEGRWNLDAENRRRVPAGTVPPRPYQPREDELDDEVRAELNRLDLPTWGEDGPRLWPADHAQARRALDHFIERALPDFGPYEDAMVAGERTLWHSLLSSSLNLGLIGPLECIAAAEAAYHDGAAPLQSVEGFVRQVMGWREYIWCMYWHVGDAWQGMNALKATSPLPALLDGAPTEMACLDDAVQGLRDTAYGHHIQRLMLFGNLMLVAGVDPAVARDWYHRVYIDGYDWVMAPNVVGMATWADGGIMMTKPYAASGRYVSRMSDYCKQCRYDPGMRTGESACPFTVLYWDFLDRNRGPLGVNRRMAMSLRNLDCIAEDELDQIRTRAAALREHFDA